MADVASRRRGLAEIVALAKPGITRRELDRLISAAANYAAASRGTVYNTLGTDLKHLSRTGVLQCTRGRKPDDHAWQVRHE